MGPFSVQEPAKGGDAGDQWRVREVLRRCGVLPSERERAAFDSRNLEQDLGRLLRGGNVEQHRSVLDLPLARPALAGECGFVSCSLLGDPDPVMFRID